MNKDNSNYNETKQIVETKLKPLFEAREFARNMGSKMGSRFVPENCPIQAIIRAVDEIQSRFEMAYSQ